MRFLDHSRTIIQVLSLSLAVSLAPTASAQFREISPDQPDGSTAAELVPTNQPFVPPKVEPPKAVPEQLQPVPVPVLDSVVPTPLAVPTETPANTPTPIASEQQAAESVPPVPKQDDEPTAVEISTVDPFQSFKTESAGAATAPSPSDRVGHSALIFNQAEPGATTLEELRAEWGDPAKFIESEEGNILVYAFPGFRQVDVYADADGDLVQSILVHLSKPMKSEEIHEHLGLAELRPVEIPDESGTPIAHGFPERGVLLTFDDQSKTDLVAQISMEPIRGDMFRLRAEHDNDHQVADSLADLEDATRLDDQDDKAFWLKAELLCRVGRFKDASESSEVALRLAPENPLYRLTSARLNAANGQTESGITDTQAVLDDPDTSTIVRARAEYQLGNLMASGPDPVFEDAMAHHLKAIDLAVKHVNDETESVRRMAKDVLVDSHLAIAQDVALGNFQRQAEVVPKWLTRAAQLAEDFISRDEGDETIRMEIYRTTLAIYSVMEGNFDASIATDEALKEGKRLIAAADDKLYQARVERELSETLLHAARVEQQRGRSAEAMNYASNAVALLTSQEQERQPSMFDQVMEGQLYFLVGSLYALTRDDHQEAVRWYERAKPMFTHDALQDLVDSSSFGDLFVSMGVSYWTVGEREKAVELTQAGAELMQQAVQVGSLDLAALTVPYGNLASMHKHLGNGTQATHFAEMMARVEKEATMTR